MYPQNLGRMAHLHDEWNLDRKRFDGTHPSDIREPQVTPPLGDLLEQTLGLATTEGASHVNDTGSSLWFPHQESQATMNHLAAVSEALHSHENSSSVEHSLRRVFVEIVSPGAPRGAGVASDRILRAENSNPHNETRNRLTPTSQYSLDGVRRDRVRRAS